MSKIAVGNGTLPPVGLCPGDGVSPASPGVLRVTLALLAVRPQMR